MNYKQIYLLIYFILHIILVSKRSSFLSEKNGGFLYTLNIVESELHINS
jgi:hypothetical protein